MKVNLSANLILEYFLYNIIIYYIKDMYYIK